MKVKKILLVVAMFSIVFSSVCFGVEGGWWGYDCDCETSFWSSDVTAWATSSSTWDGYAWKIYRIKAKTRLYVNYVLYSFTDDNPNSSYAAASVTAEESKSCSNKFMYSNHTFEQSGYNDYTPEGYDGDCSWY